MENRFSTFTEVRHVLWPDYETPEFSPAQFLQGIAGTLELFHRSSLSFQQVAGEATGHPVAVFQRVDQVGYRLPIDERILADTDTLMVFGLDHLLSEQVAAPEEVEAIRAWLQPARAPACCWRRTTTSGFTDDLAQRQVEYLHHGDALVPRQQRFGQYTRSLMKALDVPVRNIWGLRPARAAGGEDIAPLTRLPRPRQAGPADRRPDVQLSPAPAALRADRRGPGIDPSAGATAGRSRPSASVHRRRQHRVQLPALDAAGGRTRRRHRAGRFDALHDAVRRHRQPHALLAEPGPDEMKSPLKLPSDPPNLAEATVHLCRHPREHAALGAALLTLAALVAGAVALQHRELAFALGGLWLSMIVVALQAPTYNRLRGAEVTATQFPEIHRLLVEVCQRFGAPPIRVFVIRSPVP